MVYMGLPGRIAGSSVHVAHFKLGMTNRDETERHRWAASNWTTYTRDNCSQRIKGY